MPLAMFYTMASRRQNLLMPCKLINFWLSWPTLLMGDMQMAVEGEPGQKAFWCIPPELPRRGCKRCKTWALQLCSFLSLLAPAPADGTKTNGRAWVDLVLLQLPLSQSSLPNGLCRLQLLKLMYFMSFVDVAPCLNPNHPE